MTVSQATCVESVEIPCVDEVTLSDVERLYAWKAHRQGRCPC